MIPLYLYLFTKKKANNKLKLFDFKGNFIITCLTEVFISLTYNYPKSHQAK